MPRRMRRKFEHLADPAAAVKKAVGWLEPGGLMYVEVRLRDSYSVGLCVSFTNLLALRISS